MDEYPRAVLDPLTDDSFPDFEDASPGRTQSIPRTTRPLPTDRMKFEKQTEALRAYVTASNFGTQAVGSKAIANRIGLIEATAALVNTFFFDAGLLIKEGRGLYRPIPAVVQYQREYSVLLDKASRHLAEPLKESWYYTAIEADLAAGKVSEETLILVLAEAAGTDATGPRRVQLEFVLEWLAYAGLIVRDEGFAQTAGIPGGLTSQTPIDATPADTPSEEPTTISGATAPLAAERVMGFSFDLSLTAADIAKLTPDQIKALFAAVGTVMSIKGAIAN